MRKILLIAVAFSFLTATAYSQEDVLRPKGKTNSESSSKRSPWAIGLEAGLGYNMYSADLNWTDANGNPTDANSVFNVFESQSGLSPHIGFFVDYDINSTFGIHTKFLYNNFSYNNETQGIVDFKEANTSILLGTEIVDVKNEESFNFISFDPSLRINATDDLYFLVGPSFNYGIGTYKGTFTLTKEDNLVKFVLEDGSLSNVSTITAENDFKSTRYGLNFGVGYKFHLVNSVYIAPQVNYNMDLTSYNDLNAENLFQQESQPRKTLQLTNQTINQLRFSVTLWFENL